MISITPILIGGLVLVGAVVLCFLIFRKGKIPPTEDGRPDNLERPELRGTEQSKQRELP